MMRTSAPLRGSSSRSILGLLEGHSYTPEEIKRAFRAKALAAHPDAGGDSTDFVRLQAAYKALLREQGEGKGQEEEVVTDKGDDSARGGSFYAHPHAQWANDTRARNAYWSHMYADVHGSEWGGGWNAFDGHFRARPHRHMYGEGLGEEFQNEGRTSSAFSSSARNGQAGTKANFSTWHFYRPYESDYRNPFGTGFSAEEIRRATADQRRGVIHAVIRYTFLCCGVAFVVYQHESHNRVRRATEAREKGYQDPEYWAQLRKEEEEARESKRAPLRLEHHWLDGPLVVPSKNGDWDRGGEVHRVGHSGGNGEKLTSAQTGTALETQPAKKAVELGQESSRSIRVNLRSGSRAASGPRVISYKGRPFTPNGIRRVRETAFATAKVCADDVTYDPSDWEDDNDHEVVRVSQ